jgi:hypothetical protein
VSERITLSETIQILIHDRQSQRTFSRSKNAGRARWLEIELSQLGPDFLLLDEANDFENPAQVILSLDVVTHRRDVQLQCGSTSTEKTISFL